MHSASASSASLQAGTCSTQVIVSPSARIRYWDGRMEGYMLPLSFLTGPEATTCGVGQQCVDGCAAGPVPWLAPLVAFPQRKLCWPGAKLRGLSLRSLQAGLQQGAAGPPLLSCRSLCSATPLAAHTPTCPTAPSPPPLPPPPLAGLQARWLPALPRWWASWHSAGLGSAAPALSPAKRSET